jgi:hypothetical protein
MLTGVVGCTSSGSNGPSGTPSTSAPSRVSTAVTSPISAPTPSPSVATTGPNVRPGEKPPVLPDLATHNSRAGAAEFARFWFRALDWGYATTDSTLAKSLYLSACTDCARFMRNFDGPKAKGEHFTGGRSIVLNTKVVSGDTSHPGTTPIDVRITVGALKTLSAKGRTVASAPASPTLTYRLWLQRVGSEWRVLDSKQVVSR